jgi:peptide deformylase
MALLEIIKIGHPTLALKAAPVAAIDSRLRDLARNMVETLYAAPGVGLAAPQVGVSERLIVVDVTVGKDPQSLFILFNPLIVEQQGEAVCEEGCLSVPDITEKVSRPYRVTVKALDLEGREILVEGEDYLARALCHEIDHLDGKLFIDRLSPLKRALIRKKIRKLQEKPDLS